MTLERVTNSIDTISELGGEQSVTQSYTDEVGTDTAVGLLVDLVHVVNCLFACSSVCEGVRGGCVTHSVIRCTCGVGMLRAGCIVIIIIIIIMIIIMILFIRRMLFIFYFILKNIILICLVI